MGMFDYVEYDYNCKECGEPLSDFQSKDGDCELGTVQPSDVSEFYTSCDKCGSWHDFEVKKTCVVSSIEVTNSPSKR